MVTYQVKVHRGKHRDREDDKSTYLWGSPNIDEVKSLEIPALLTIRVDEDSGEEIEISRYDPADHANSLLVTLGRGEVFTIRVDDGSPISAKCVKDNVDTIVECTLTFLARE